MFRPGELNQRVTLQRPTATEDGLGGHEHGWQDVREVWARVRALNGKEQEQSERLQAEGGYMVAIYNRSDVRENWRVVWRGWTMNVEFIMREGPQPLYIRLLCTRGVAT